MLAKCVTCPAVTMLGSQCTVKSVCITIIQTQALTFTNTVCPAFKLTEIGKLLTLIRKLARRQQKKRHRTTSNLGPEAMGKVCYWFHLHRAKMWVWPLSGVNILQILMCRLWPDQLAFPRLVQGTACARDHSC